MEHSAKVSSNRSKVKRFIHAHRLILVVVITVAIFALGKAFNYEMLAKGGEIMVEPIIDRLLEEV